jgi:putative exporter of polyketide antibiotics
MPFYFSNLILQFASSFVLEEHRDLNTGYIPEREGKPLLNVLFYPCVVYYSI